MTTFRFMWLVVAISAAFGADEPRAQNAQSADPIKIPVLTALTGPLAILGQDGKKGIEIAVDQINRAGGIAGRKLIVEVSDSQGKPDTARREMERLVRLQNAPLVLGCDISAATASAAQFAEASQVALLNSAAVSSEILNRHYHWYFTQQITNNDEADMVLAFLKTISGDLKTQKIALLYEDSPRGAGTGELVRKLLDKEGIKPTAEVSYNRAERNLLPFMKKLQETEPSILVWAGYTEDIVAGIKAMQQLEFVPYVIGVGGGAGDPRLPTLVDAKFIDRLKLSNIDYFNSDFKRVAALVEEYRAKYNATPSSYVGICYAGGMTLKPILEAAYKKSNNPTRADIQSVLRDLNIPGDQTAIPGEFIKFDPDGRNLGARALVTQWKGEATRKATVFPASIATDEPSPLK
jgi:branched-chain amino acid transport system substrate-binding protein